MRPHSHRIAPPRVIAPILCGMLAAASVSDTTWTTSPLSPPTVRYGSYAAARDSLARLLRQRLGAWADSARWSTAKERFIYRDALRLNRSILDTYYWTVEPRDTAVLVPCLHMTLSTSREDAPGAGSIEEMLEAAGWERDLVYDADGPDGTHFAYVCDRALCEVEASWDGGDDSDSTYVPAPGQDIELRCVPLSEEYFRRRSRGESSR